MKTQVASPRAPKNPKLYYHKASGQGYVILNGRTIYLGKFDLPETQQKYHRLMAEWMAQGQQLPVAAAAMTVSEIIARFINYAENYYRGPDGRASSEVAAFTLALRPLRELYGSSKAAEFGPLSLTRVRDKMVELGWCRKYVNHQVRRVKTAFKWAASQELVPASVFHGLQTLDGLRRGRSSAPESIPVRPVSQADIDAIKPFVSEQVWAIIQLQLVTAARPGELLIMRPGDVDRSGVIWVYRPTDHKTAHHGHDRIIYIGPRGQQILTPYLLRSDDAYCFSAAEAEDARREAAFQSRKTPLSCGHRRGMPTRGKGEHVIGECYDRDSYRRAIAYGCEWAFPPPEPLAKRSDETKEQWRARLTPQQKEELRAWRRAHRWHPHQLRHNAATYLRKEFNLETARIILGHRSAAITTIYAEADQQKAIEAMLKVG